MKAPLTDAERLRIKDSEYKWPKYPLTIQELADAHRLPPPPWQTALPGPSERWDSYRELDLNGLPEVSRQTLYDFAIYQLNAQDRAKLQLSVTDPLSVRRLQEEFWRCKLDEFLKLPQFDPKKMPHKLPFFLLPPDKRH
jgi:hypothetical protein